MSVEDFQTAATALVEQTAGTPPEPVEPSTPATTDAPASTVAPESAPSAPKSTATAPPITAKSPPRATPQQTGGPASGDITKALRDERAQNRDYKQTYGWLSKEEAPTVKAFVEAWKRDPVGALGGELKVLAQHPHYAAQLRALMGELFGGTVVTPAAKQPQRPADDDDEDGPGADYHNTDGSGFVSFDRQREREAWLLKRWEKQFSERMKPIQSWVEQRQQQDVYTGLQTNAEKSASQLLTEMQTYPHFTENIDAIRDRYADLQHSMDGKTALYRAYLSVLHEQVLPNLNRSEKQQLATDLNRKPGATTPNPARATAVAGAKHTEDWREAAERVLRRA